MKYDAVIFDLFGTLVDRVDHPESNALRGRQVAIAMANTISAPQDDFLRLWCETMPQRDAGAFQTTEACLTYLLRELDIPANSILIHEAAQLRLEYYRHVLVPRSDAIDTLKTLKTDGYKIGLLSNCSNDVAVLWPTTPFAKWIDAAVFSCEVRLRKPDPHIYHVACERLGVQPKGCLFVGDGANNELTAASELGMGVVLIRAPYDTEDGNRQSWNGTGVSALQEVAFLLSQAP